VLNPSIANDNRPAATDGLFDTSAKHLAEVFGRRTLEMMRTGRDPYQAARLAATFAGRELDRQGAN
jgi:hypothetical protein